MSLQKPSLSHAPLEILERIALEVVLATPLGPPSSIIPILLTCKTINHALKFDNNPAFYAKVYLGKFDTSAARRRLGPSCLRSSNLADQLLYYTATLKRVRFSDVYDNGSDIGEALWGAFLLLLENDGKNLAQLQWAKLADFVQKRVRFMLDDGRRENNGWPADTHANSLTLWLMAMTLREGESIESISPKTKTNLFVQMPFLTRTFVYEKISLIKSYRS